MTNRRSRRRWLRPLLGASFVVLVALGTSWLVRGFLDGQPDKPRRSVQEITLLAPPPPPPPPKVEEPPPEPEMEEPVEVPEPEAMEELPDMPDEEPPPGRQLGLDAEGGAGSDGFGLIGRKGGRSLLSGNAFGWYSGQLQKDIHEVLSGLRQIRSKRYSLVVTLWIGNDGRITDARVRQGTGDPELDSTIARALRATRVAEAPPREMPQPVRVRITSRL